MRNEPSLDLPDKIPFSGDTVLLNISRVDFEAFDLPTFPVDIIENGDPSTLKSITLKFKNIDDESPILSVTTCNMKVNFNIFSFMDFLCFFVGKNRHNNREFRMCIYNKRSRWFFEYHGF